MAARCSYAVSGSATDRRANGPESEHTGLGCCSRPGTCSSISTCAATYGWRSWRHDTDAPRCRVDDLLEQVGIAARRHAYPTELSGGELARAGLAVALANDPDVVLADEPTGELDGDTEQQVLGMLADRAGRGAGLVVVTHSPEVARMADRILTLTDGQISP